jgi:hypothetical protein
MKGLIGLTEQEVMEKFMDYGDTITHYYDVVAKRCIKRNYKEKKGMGYLKKLDEWEMMFEENLSIEVEMGA